MNMYLLPTAAVAVAALAAYSIANSQPVRESNRPPNPPPVPTFENSLAASGIVEASSENIAIGTPLGGVVAAVRVGAGNVVEKGALLFELDTRHLAAQLRARQAAVVQMKAGVQTAHVALSDAEDAWNRRENLEKRKVMSVDETRRAEFAVQSARARVAEAEANLAAAEADVHTVEVELERSRVLAPIGGTILRVDIRAGEYASAGGGGGNSLIVIGNVAPLHARVDVDESETWRFAPDAAATASVRGNARQRSRLRYVRTEPLVRPKQMLTGSASERVDTRVLQVIYEILEPTGFYVGQQLDVFIDEQHLAAAGTER